ncbi:C3 and PZP-like alpha-2-macroglobulin domain-containing protein 8 [Branchiostoma floridae]|uniref:C3 and PZP-like alpha-2-macroglobulin domain-containing protein 8 n=1 Tax=Branchiostoma floridae TaxID=7739 RepID=A0A9J7NBM5_BRAFL|nr:C3 and PZP-like alpha-2-macroglobulin domain-containing protein 8 [Branchiostoma floridae]
MFEVKAERDVHVALSSRQDQDLDEIYEIVIGGWDNMRSVIRRSRQGYNHVDVQTPNIVSKTEYRTFWIMWSSDGTIAVGRGDENLPFMLWRDPDPLPINYAGLKSDWRNVDRKVGQWKLCRTARPDDAECLVEPAMRHECGWAGITSDQCRSKGCCYNTATTRPEIPWCFHRAKKGGLYSEQRSGYRAAGKHVKAH